MEEDGLTPKKLERLINSAANPVVAYRREICFRLVRQTYNQFGMEGLYDILTGVDNIGSMTSVVVSDRNEIENYVFEKYGIFDPDMFEKMQLSQDWEDFMGELLEWSSQRIADIIDKVIEDEKN
jgi:hypothetical protein